MSRNLAAFGYFLKNAVKDKGFAFWTIMYPLVLITIFYFGFSGVMNREFEKAPIGVSPEHPFASVFGEIDIIEYSLMDEAEAKNALAEDEIVAYIKKDGNMLVGRSDSAQTAVKEVLDAMNQFSEMMKSGVPFEQVKFDAVYTETIEQSEDSWRITFYSGIAMISIYSVFTGIQISKQDGFNSRISVSPFKKSTRITCYFFLGLLVNMVVNIVLVFYVQKVLRINLFPHLWKSLAIIACGNVFGISLGILLGIPKKIKEDAKMSMAIGLSLMLSFFAGMMGREIPRMLWKISPWIPKLNPVANITNLLMRVNLIGSTQHFLQDLMLLVIQAMIMLIVGFVILWRRKYECD